MLLTAKLLEAARYATGARFAARVSAEGAPGEAWPTRTLPEDATESTQRDPAGTEASP